MTGSMPKLACDLDHDVDVLVAMAANLTPYLYQDEIFGAMPGNLPRLTLGGLLLRLHRLIAIQDLLKPTQQTAVHDARLNFEADAAKWAVHYEKKLQIELASRLNALDQFMRECYENRSVCIAGYPVQAEKRIMIEHLKNKAEQNNVLNEELSTRVKECDQRLHRLTSPGEFLFVDDRLQAAYPSSPFWWLYAHVADHRD